jgi:hypothetical protein
MVKRSMSDEERRLRDRLKREADAMQPEFSEALHQRVMGAIRQAPAPERPSRARLAGWMRRPGGWLSLAAAASVAAAIGLVVWHFAFVPAPGPMPRPGFDELVGPTPPDHPVVPAPQQPPLYDPQLPLVDQTATPRAASECGSPPEE